MQPHFKIFLSLIYCKFNHTLVVLRFKFDIQFKMPYLKLRFCFCLPAHPFVSVNRIYHSRSESIIFSIIVSVSEAKDRVFHVLFILLSNICFRWFIFMLHVLLILPIFLFDTEAVDINPVMPMLCFHFFKCIYLLQMFGFYFIYLLIFIFNSSTRKLFLFSLIQRKNSS